MSQKPLKCTLYIIKASLHEEISISELMNDVRNPKSVGYTVHIFNRLRRKSVPYNALVAKIRCDHYNKIYTIKYIF